MFVVVSCLWIIVSIIVHKVIYGIFFVLLLGVNFFAVHKLNKHEALIITLVSLFYVVLKLEYSMGEDPGDQRINIKPMLMFPVAYSILIAKIVVDHTNK